MNSPATRLKPSGFAKFLVIACLSVMAGCTESQLLLINSLARFDDYTVIEDVAYDDNELNYLDIYLPPARKASRATVIFFYGGCWGGCETFDKEHYRFVAQALTSHGYAVVIPDYRRHPEFKFPVIIDDAKQVVEWVKAQLDNYGGRTDKIFLMGHSAGAHLAAMLTLNEVYLSAATYRSVKGFVGLAGPYDFLPFTDGYQKVVFGPEENYPISQPVNFVGGSEPPLLLLYGNNDDTVKPVNIQSLSRKVKVAGGCVETHVYSELDHAELLGALSLPFQSRLPVLADITGFLDYYSGHCVCRSFQAVAG